MTKTRVIYYTSDNNKNSFQKFLDALGKKQQTKILRVFLQIEEYGLSSILPHTKKITGTPLWEIRILGKDNLRVLYIVPYQETILALHGFIKKTQKTSIKELKIAKKRLLDWQSHH